MIGGQERLFAQPEMVQVTRCRDCMYGTYHRATRMPQSAAYVECNRGGNRAKKPDWFCADGKVE